MNQTRIDADARPDETWEVPAGETPDGAPDGGADEAEAAPAPVEVRRNGAVAAAVASVAVLVAAAYLARAASTGGLLDWAVFAAMAVLALAYARSWIDARTPLLVADATGIRMRLGRTWHGLPWADLEEVEHAPRQGLLRDGRLVAFPVDPEASLAALDPRARRQAVIAQKVHGAPFAVPLGLTTAVSGADEGLTRALLALAPDAQLVVEVVPGADDAPYDGAGGGAAAGCEANAESSVDVPVDPELAPEPQDNEDTQDTGNLGDPGDPEETAVRPSPWRRAAGVARGALVARRDVPAPSHPADPADPVDPVDTAEDTAAASDAQGLDDTVVRPGPLVPTSTPSPLREPSRAVRADVTRHAPAVSQVGVPVPRPDAVPDPQTPVANLPGDLPKDTDRGPATTDVEGEVGPAHDPVIGPRLTAAREALGLSVDQLAARTRIRAHVIEGVEVDDFGPCGGDFYARGHLRTLARVLGVDAVPLLATYDETYAAAPIEARRAFEAELSTGAGGSIRSLRGGPNWSVVVAAVMAVVLAWSIARLVMDQPRDSAADTPSLASGSAGLTSATTDLPPAVPVVLTADGGGAKVVVRDGAGEVLFKGDLAFGQSRTVKVSPPIRVQSSDGSLTVGIDGQDPEAIGRPGRAARDTFVP